MKRTRTIRLLDFTVERRRPVHKRVLLHPATVFLLLCVGVLVAGSTFHGQAISYDVSAKVSAPALKRPAVITSPAGQRHVTDPLVAVQGICPDNSYVSLYREGVFSGVAVCDNNNFQIQATLALGANELRARVFNLTDDEGPVSPPATVYYDLSPVVTPPARVPTALAVADLDKQAYARGALQDVDSHPTVGGLAPPFSDITVTFHSDPTVCRTKADGRGVWSCTLSEALAPGLHTVDIMAVTPTGQQMVLPSFYVRVTEYAQAFTVTSDYHYQAHSAGQSVEWQLGLTGGTPPYNLSIDWGDGTTGSTSRPDGSTFTLSHAYTKLSAADQNFTVLITVVDARGATTTIQLVAVVKATAALANTHRTLFGGLVSFVRQWLWVVWPAYIAVVLMVVSFWIGEREAYRQFMERRRLRRPRPHAKGR